MLMVTFSDLLGSLDFWRGLGKAVIIGLLIYALLVVVLAELGVSNALLPKRSTGRPDPDDSSDSHDEVAHETSTRPPTASRGSSEAHREYLDRLRTGLKYQGSTVALIVFSVLILGVLHVLDGPEVATILSGIAGFVLGTARADKAADPPPSGADGPGNPAPPKGAEPPFGTRRAARTRRPTPNPR